MVAYQQLHGTGELKARAEKAQSILEECCLCPRHCGVNRRAGESGKCHITSQAVISSYGPHFGEEAPLVGRYGSGTIFFTYCNLQCVFCQNYTISQLDEGRAVRRQEFLEAINLAHRQGLYRLDRAYTSLSLRLISR